MDEELYDLLKQKRKEEAIKNPGKEFRFHVTK